MSMTLFRRLGRGPEDLIKTNVVLKDFEGGTSEVEGVPNVVLTIGRKTIPTSFFIISGKGPYNLLLQRDWIHANCCIPSMMHQILIHWKGDQVMIVQADTTINVATTNLDIWQLDTMNCLSGQGWSGQNLNVTNQGIEIMAEEGPELYF
jgi:hypothetical protein